MCMSLKYCVDFITRYKVFCNVFGKTKKCYIESRKELWEGNLVWLKYLKYVPSNFIQRSLLCKCDVPAITLDGHILLPFGALTWLIQTLIHPPRMLFLPLMEYFLVSFVLYDIINQVLLDRAVIGHRWPSSELAGLTNGPREGSLHSLVGLNSRNM